MIKKKICDTLNHLGQFRLREGLDMLSFFKKWRFYRQLKTLDRKVLQEQRALLPASEEAPFIPLLIPSQQSEFKYSHEGNCKQLGCIVLAGGEGRRLGFHAPKGCLPITFARHKSLFQLIVEKVLAASRQSGVKIPLAIMTSQATHDQAVSFLKAHDFFGMAPAQVDFFSQESLPFVDSEGNWFLEKPGIIAQGPNGNGSFFSQFVRSKLWERWNRKGVKYLSVVPIDNPLADPCDAEMQEQCQKGHDLTIRCIRFKKGEKLGTLGTMRGHLAVKEYMEASHAPAQDFSLGYTGLFCCSMEFAKRASQKILPLHRVEKQGSKWEAGKEQKISFWKYEYFIFDAFAEAKSYCLLETPREVCFSPIKNLKGNDSVKTALSALLNKDRMVFQALSGHNVAERSFELDPAFYYPTKALIATWRGRPLPEGNYIKT